MNCIEIKSFNAWKNSATKFQQIKFHYNCEICLSVKHHLATIYCCVPKNIISMIEYESWYFKLVSCYCRMVTILRGALQVGIIWLYTTLLTYKCIHYTSQLSKQNCHKNEANKKIINSFVFVHAYLLLVYLKNLTLKSPI